MTFVLGITLLAMTASGLLMLLLERAYHRPPASLQLLATAPVRPVEEREMRRLFAINGALSGLLLLGVPVLAFPFLFREGVVTPWRVLIEACGVLLAYDLLYYAMHRTLHHKRIMRFVHRVHHLVRAPSARQSMYVHPVEFCAGILLLFLCVRLVGPVHVYAYALALVPFQLVNVIIHAGVSFRSGPLRLLNGWARGHHGHHGVDVNRNFGQFTPLWDLLFGTAIR